MANRIALTPLKRFFNLLKVDQKDIFSIYVYALFNGILTLSLPLGIQAIINLIGGGQTSTSWMVLVFFVILGVALTGVMQIMQLTISENLQQKIFTRSAFEFGYRIPKFKLESIDKAYIPELVNRFFDTLTVQKGLSKILMDFSGASLQVIFGLILLSMYHPFFILFSVVTIAIVYLIFRFTAPIGLRTSIYESKNKYEVAHWLEELARAMETFKLAGHTSLPLEKTDKLVKNYIVSRKVHFKTLLSQYINLVGFKVVIAGGLLIIGSLLVINQKMNIGQFVASEIIIILVLSSVEKLILSMETIYDVLTAVQKIGEVTDIPLEVNTGAKVKYAKNDGLELNINNLSYRFENEKENVLNGVNMKLKAGEKMCLSGFNGSGKSLLLQLIAGLYEEYIGSISYDGIPMGNWCRDDLRTLIGDDLIKEEIFKGTLMENITLGRSDVSFKDVQHLSGVVGLSDFLEKLPKGYNTYLLPEGKTLPKSVRLKIILIRSLVNNPKLILLEENFNFLAVKYRDQLLDYILNLNATIIAISNNPEVAKQFDRVLVLDGGDQLYNGSFKEVQKESWYSTIFNN